MHDDSAALAPLVTRTEGLQPWRRVVHALTGILLALAPGWLTWEATRTAALLAAATGLLFVADGIRLSVPRLNRWFFRVFRLLASPREAAGIASSTWFLLGATLAWAIAPGPPATTGLLVLALADPAASIVGRRWGRAKLGKGTREGTAAFAAVSYLVVWAAIGLPATLPVAILVAMVEVAPLGLDDNLTVPVATALAIEALPFAGLS
jgi:dolichol kinase